jgi:Glucosidase II beta subunit-like protein
MIYNESTRKCSNSLESYSWESSSTLPICNVLITVKSHASSLLHRPITFQCPQQPGVKIPASRVRDGVCDCCDGADEKGSNGTTSKTTCPDQCAALLAAAAAAKRDLEQRFQLGSRKRATALSEFAAYVKETEIKLKQAYETALVKREERDQIKIQTVGAKQVFVEQRVARVKDQVLALAAAPKTGLLSGLTVEELRSVILHACQVAGEMPDAASSKTCVPLRLAALDMGGVWQAGDSYSFQRILDAASVLTPEAKEQQITALANILRHNSHDDNEKVWQESDLNNSQKRYRKSSRKRRSSSDNDEDDYDEDDDDDEEDTDQSSDNSSAAGNDSKRDELTYQVRYLPFSATRDTFLENGAAILEKIKQETETSTESVEGEQNHTASAQGGKASPTMDPMVLPMIKNTISKRERRIRKGLDYGVSAKVLLEAVIRSTGATTAQQVLQRLAIGTLNYGKLSTVQFYQILTYVIPELNNVAEFDPQTCPLPWADICPPKDIVRDGARVPPAAVMDSVRQFCKQASKSMTSAACAQSADDASEVAIPSEVPDGYFGYFEVEARDDDDMLSNAFTNLGFQASGDEESADSALKEIESTLDRRDREVEDLEREIKEMEDSIGGGNEDASKFGPNGELHSLRDQCFEVTEGKYVYKVCMFRSATQRDQGTEDGGTDLGSWSEATTEVVTDQNGVEYEQRVWRWANGAHCWNGPSRSATGYVSCGAETRILSADEPDTCRYVLQMESPLACDEEFQTRHGL